MLELRAPEIERFWGKTGRTEDTKSCWLWTQSVNNKGYGQTSFRRDKNKINLLAHRVAYFLATGWEPTQLHHLCGNKRCCNPLHLRPIGAQEHYGIHRKDMCVHGHAFTAANSYITKNGHRLCRACNARWHREHRQALAR